MLADKAAMQRARVLPYDQLMVRVKGCKRIKFCGKFEEGVNVKTSVWIAIASVLLSSCAIPTTYKRDMHYAPPPNLSLSVPKGKKKVAKSSFMVAFVAPRFDTEMLETYKAPTAMSLNNTGYVGPYRKMDLAKEPYFKAVKQNLLTDIEHVLLAKNIRVLGPFKTWDDMTFDDKKRAIYIFEPVVHIDVATQFTQNTNSGYSEKGYIIVNGNIEFTLRESITKEKLWIKRLEADEVKKPYEFVVKFKQPQLTPTNVPMMMMVSQIEEVDNTDKVLAVALSEFYARLGDKIWRHIDPEEWEKYLRQANNLRGVKRF